MNRTLGCLAFIPFAALAACSSGSSLGTGAADETASSRSESIDYSLANFRFSAASSGSPFILAGDNLTFTVNPADLENLLNPQCFGASCTRGSTRSRAH